MPLKESAEAENEPIIHYLDKPVPMLEVADSINDTIFKIWFLGVTGKAKLRAYKVPAKILSLPCGCVRMRANEGDPNNVWNIKRKKDQFFHKECGKSIDQQN